MRNQTNVIKQDIVDPTRSVQIHKPGGSKETLQAQSVDEAYRQSVANGIRRDIADCFYGRC